MLVYKRFLTTGTTGTVPNSITEKVAFTRTLESGLGESHLSKYLCPPDYGLFDHHGFLEKHGDRTFQHHDDRYHQDDGESGVCFSFDPGEKSRRTWTQPFRSHPFFKGYPLED